MCFVLKGFLDLNHTNGDTTLFGQRIIQSTGGNENEVTGNFDNNVSQTLISVTFCFCHNTACRPPINPSRAGWLLELVASYTTPTGPILQSATKLLPPFDTTSPEQPESRQKHYTKDTPCKRYQGRTTVESLYFVEN